MQHPARNKDTKRVSECLGLGVLIPKVVMLSGIYIHVVSALFASLRKYVHVHIHCVIVPLCACAKLG